MTGQAGGRSHDAGQAGGRSHDAGQAGGRSHDAGQAGGRSDPLPAVRPRVVLIGPPGAGKSTIGRRVAKALGVELYDTDAAIEERTGRTIPDIFAVDGEAAFREIEEQVVVESLHSQSGVVSLGGGAVLSPRTRAALQGHTVVYLELGVGEGLRRTGALNANTSRPLLTGVDPKAKYRELMRIRRPLYREAASIRVRTDGRSPSRVVAAVLDRLGAPREPAETRPERPRRTGARRRSRRGAGRSASPRSGTPPPGAMPAPDQPTTPSGRPAPRSQEPT
ncbi:shikimate kinase [Rhodococcus kroppenstedtii]|nr:shikimate kinase [Rhodococcus kroppenstedtii]